MVRLQPSPESEERFLNHNQVNQEYHVQRMWCVCLFGPHEIGKFASERRPFIRSVLTIFLCAVSLFFLLAH